MITRPHGVRGEVRVRLYRDGSALLHASAVWIEGVERGIDRVRTSAQPEVALLSLSGVDDRNAAEALRDLETSLPLDTFPAREDGRFWEHEVTGLEVVAGGETLGTVVAIVNYGASDLLVVHGESLEWLVPLIAGVVLEHDAQRLVLELPEGLEPGPT